MKVGIVTQARTTSTRLPGKVLIEVSGRTLLDHHLDRLEVAGVGIYVATTTNLTDDGIANLAADRGIGCFRGSEDDVLARFAGAAVEFGLDAVVRVTSDCPLIDGRLVAQGVDIFRAANDPWTYVSNTLERSYPRGLDFEVFSTEALLDAHAHATAPSHREHVTPYLNSNASGRMVISGMVREPAAGGFRITLDTAEDLTLIRELIEQHGAAGLGGDDLIALLESHPELVAINSHVEQKKLGE